MSDNKMILHPIDAFSAPSNFNEFVEELRTLELIGDSYQRFEEIRYQPGRQFSTFIRFIHEHTAIILEDIGKGLQEVNRIPNRQMSYICLPKPEPEPSFLVSAYAENPTCPSCGYEGSFAIIGEWYKNKTDCTWPCPQCNTVSSIYDLHWTHAAFARYSIDIWHVHLDEAVPDQSLIDTLYRVTGTPWNYFYYRF